MYTNSFLTPALAHRMIVKSTFEYSIQSMQQSPKIGCSFFRLAFGFLIFSVLGGCTSESADGEIPSRTKLITQLEQNDIGATVVRIDVNDRLNALVAPAEVQSSSLQVPASLLQIGNNTINISFYLQRPNLGEVSLATARQAASYSGNAETIVVQGTAYSYPDDDADTIPNLLELLVVPDDVDNDGLENYVDADSDNDGLEDSIDPQPYGASSMQNNLSPIATFELQLPDQSLRRVSVSRIAGAGTLVSSLDTRTTAVPLLQPDNWPFTIVDAIPADNWQLIELPAASTVLCARSETAIDFDTSSIEVSATRTVIGFFQRFDGTPFTAPINSGSIPALGSFNRNDVASGNRSLDDALQGILVPANTAGFISLWTRSDFSGELCQINLATP